MASRRQRTPNLRVEPLETRINPYTVNDSGDLGAANPKTSPDTSNHTITLRSVFDYANAKKTAVSIDFASAMTIALGSNLYTSQGVKLAGLRNQSGPTVIIQGGSLQVGKGSNVSDVEITGSPGMGLFVLGNTTITDSCANSATFVSIREWGTNTWIVL
jgi:hypothetical protein